MRRFMILLVLLSVANASFGDSVVFESPAERAQLVQLFTSEGCSSCPPADMFLSTLLERDDLWTAVVPIALHVDYWDHIGWKDPYASPRYSELQRAYARSLNVESVYTPNFFVSGAEWRGFFSREPLPKTKSSPSGVLSVSTIDGSEVELRYEPVESGEAELIAFVSIVGFGAKSSVRAGENKGRDFVHDFVALSLRGGTLTKDQDGYTASYAFDRESLPDADRYGIVAWVTTAENPEPLQATGGFLD